MFTKEEATAFLTAEKFVEKLTDASTMAHYRSAMYKVRAILRSSEKDLLEGMDNRIEVLRSASQPEFASNDHIQTVLYSISQKKVLALNYFAQHSQEHTKRYVEPIGIFFLAGYWHLIAYCRLRKDYRDFRIDRIKNLTVTDEYYSDDHPALKEYIAQTAKEKEIDTVVIVIEKRIHSFLEGQKYYSGFISEKEVGDTIEMTFLTNSLEGFARWYMMFGEQADIITPDSLRDRVKELTEKLMQRNFISI
jgi:predicted DNA-binding transcriptional regulator YafY